MTELDDRLELERIEVVVVHPLDDVRRRSFKPNIWDLCR